VYIPIMSVRGSRHVNVLLVFVDSLSYNLPQPPRLNFIYK